MEGETEKILGKYYPFRVVKQAFKPELPGFAGLVNGVLFISDGVPAEYREYFFWHEVQCVEHRNRYGCAATLKEELEQVPKPILLAYTEYRCECFQALVAFYSANPPEFYNEIIASYQYLLSRLRGWIQAWR